jgi:hypothetical protein
MQRLPIQPSFQMGQTRIHTDLLVYRPIFEGFRTDLSAWGQGNVKMENEEVRKTEDENQWDGTGLEMNDDAHQWVSVSGSCDDSTWKSLSVPSILDSDSSFPGYDVNLFSHVLLTGFITQALGIGKCG